MATRRNEVLSPAPGRNLALWPDYNKSASVASYGDGGAFRIDNKVAADYGRTTDVTLGAGTWTFQVKAQNIDASAKNAAAVVRRKDNYDKLFEGHVYEGQSNLTKLSGTFTLSATTTVQVVLGLGSYGVASAGSARFVDVMIESGSVVGTYFDGSTPDDQSTDYAWTGTAYASPSTATGIATSGGSLQGWNLSFSDEFEGTTLGSKWGKYNGPSTNNEGTWDPNKVTVSGGQMHISCQDFVSGAVGLYLPQLYGRWEVKMRFPNAKGYKPTLLLWPKSEQWSDGEIDFMEASGWGNSNGHINIHDTTGNPSAVPSGGHVEFNNVDPSQWHTYVVEWTKDRITVLFDGGQLLNYTATNGNPTKPMRLAIQVDNGSPGNSLGIMPPDSNTPRPYVVDVEYVKVYTPATASTGSGGTTTAPPTQPTTQPTTETDSILATMVRNGWEGMKYRYLRADGAVQQKEADNKVTSEGAGYFAMIAVQLNDRAAFDLVESFSTNVLERRNWKDDTSSQQWRKNLANNPRLYAPTLMAWDYRPQPYAGNPANTVNDWNFATDADVDRAKALFWAYGRWGDTKYLDKALQICRELRDYGFNTLNGKAYQVTDEFQAYVDMVVPPAGGNPAFKRIRDGHHLVDANGARTTDSATGAKYPVSEYNVSYMDPSLHHMARVRGNDTFWDTALAGTWDMLTKVSDAGGGLPTTAGVFPDWNYFSYRTSDVGKIQSGTEGWDYDRATDYKYDGFRTPHRMQWTYDWYSDPQVKTILKPIADFYISEWNSQGKIAAEYAHDGTRLSGGYEKPMMTAGAVYAINMVYPGSSTATAIKTAKLAPNDHYRERDGYKYWADADSQPPSYFGDCWLTFYYLREAGLWINWGQTTNTPPSTGTGNAVDLNITDTANSDDSGALSMPVRFEVTDSLPSIIDIADLDIGSRSLSVLDFGMGIDTVELFVPSTPAAPPVAPAVVIPPTRWVIKTQDGTTLELSHFFNDVAVMRGESGFGAPPTRTAKINVPNRAGQITTFAQHDVRKGTLPLFINKPGYDNLWQKLRDLIRAMDPIVSGVIELQRIDSTGLVRSLYCRVTEGLGMDGGGDSGPNAQKLPVTFEADDPYFYGPTVDVPFALGQPKKWFPMLPVRVGASVINGQKVIQNNSDVLTWPRWTVRGPGAALVLKNDSISDAQKRFYGIGDRLAFKPDAKLADSELLVIDTAEDEKTVVGPDGNWFPKLNDRALWPLVPGRNSIRANLVGAVTGSLIGLTYRERYLMP